MEGQYLGMYDPCPHITRMEVIKWRLDGNWVQLDHLAKHLEKCKAREK